MTRSIMHICKGDLVIGTRGEEGLYWAHGKSVYDGELWIALSKREMTGDGVWYWRGARNHVVDLMHKYGWRYATPADAEPFLQPDVLLQYIKEGRLADMGTRKLVLA